MIELRCANKKFGVVVEGDGTTVVEVKCDSRLAGCDAERGVVVLHKFTITDGVSVHTSTARFTDPALIANKERV